MILRIIDETEKTLSHDHCFSSSAMSSTSGGTESCKPVRTYEPKPSVN